LLDALQISQQFFDLPQGAFDSSFEIVELAVQLDATPLKNLALGAERPCF